MIKLLIVAKTNFCKIMTYLPNKERINGIMNIKNTRILCNYTTILFDCNLYVS